MELIKRIKSSFDRKFEKRPVLGNIIYGILTGFVVFTCLLLIIIIFTILTGLHSKYEINYKTWQTVMLLPFAVAVIAFVIGAFAYFPYRRKGNGGFKRDYVKGTSYKALHSILNSKGYGDGSDE